MNILLWTYLVTVGTVPGFDVGQRPVGLSVPSQIARRTITFPTIRTLTFLIVVVRFLRRLFRTYCIMVVIINIVFLQLNKTGYYSKNLFRKSVVFQKIFSLKLLLQSIFDFLNGNSKLIYFIFYNRIQPVHPNFVLILLSYNYYYNYFIH